MATVPRVPNSTYSTYSIYSTCSTYSIYSTNSSKSTNNTYSSYSTYVQTVQTVITVITVTTVQTYFMQFTQTLGLNKGCFYLPGTREYSSKRAVHQLIHSLGKDEMTVNSLLDFAQVSRLCSRVTTTTDGMDWPDPDPRDSLSVIDQVCQCYRHL